MGFDDEPDPSRLIRDLVRGYAVEVDHDVASLEQAVRGHNLPAAMDGGTTLVISHSEQLTHVTGAEDFTSLGRGRHVVLIVEAIQRVGERGGQHTTGDQVRHCRAEERRAALSTSKQLQRLHRHDDQRKPSVHVEVTRVSDDSVDP